MNTLLNVLAILASAFAVLFIFIQLKRGGATGTVFKAIASLMFVALGTAALDSGTRAGLFVLFGLVLGLAGDILLGAYITGADGEAPYLIGGIGVFAVEHIAVMTGATVAHGYDATKLIIAAVIGVVGAFATVFTEKKMMKFEFGKFLIPSAFYAFILAMSIAYYVILTIGNPSFLPVPIGMAMFLISDLILSAIFFGGKDKPI
ncbi:MAG: hypothetical protein KBS59_04765, partial [Clostridiales bacterium]|nr:hypothetical protein [Clostridiales bacterium]